MFWGDRVFSLVSSEISGLQILWSLTPATEIIGTSKKWHQIIEIRIIRLSPSSLTVCSLPENSIESIEVTPSKSEESKVFQNVSGLTCFIHLYEPMADELLLKQDEKEQGKPKVVANDDKWTPRTQVRWIKLASHANTKSNTAWKVQKAGCAKVTLLFISFRSLPVFCLLLCMC